MAHVQAGELAVRTAGAAAGPIALGGHTGAAGDVLARQTVVNRHELLRILRIEHRTPGAQENVLRRLYRQGFPRCFSRGLWRSAEVKAWLAGPQPAVNAEAAEAEADAKRKRRADRAAKLARGA